jgi:hypothetical protein
MELLPFGIICEQSHQLVLQNRSAFCTRSNSFWTILPPSAHSVFDLGEKACMVLLRIPDRSFFRRPQSR